MKDDSKTQQHERFTFLPSGDAGREDHDEFMVPACDAKGHSARLNFRAPPGYGRRIDLVVSSKKTPHKTKSDVLRFCLHVGLQELERRADRDD